MQQNTELLHFHFVILLIIVDVASDAVYIAGQLLTLFWHVLKLLLRVPAQLLAMVAQSHWKGDRGQTRCKTRMLRTIYLSLLCCSYCLVLLRCLDWAFAVYLRLGMLAEPARPAARGRRFKTDALVRSSPGPKVEYSRSSPHYENEGPPGFV